VRRWSPEHKGFSARHRPLPSSRADTAFALIIICSPAAVQSRWVGIEIDAFRATRRNDRAFLGSRFSCFDGMQSRSRPVRATVQPSFPPLHSPHGL
jgi:hypothetical protein